MTNFSIQDLIEQGNGLAYYTATAGGVKTEYFCTPRQPGLLVSETGWKIMRMQTDSTTTDMIAGKAITWAGGSPDFAYAATDLSTVAGYTYS